MSANATYRIDFHGLAIGKDYTYDFPVDDRFFGRWPESEVSSGQGRVEVKVVRHASMLELDVRIEAEVKLTCDRCLDEFCCPVSFEGHPVVKISDSVPEGERYAGAAYREGDNNSDGDILWISTAEDSLDLGQYIYESIMLSLPFQRVHPELKDCNPDMLRRFRIVSEEEFDRFVQEGAAEEGAEETDKEGGKASPFAALAKLKHDDSGE